MLTELILLAVTAYMFYVYLVPKRTENFPPGPTIAIPIFASRTFKKYGQRGYEVFSNLGKEYGNVMGIVVGKRKLVVVNGYEASKAFYALDEFAHRPELFTVSYRWGGRQLGVFFSNGRLWQEQRRFTIRHLRDFGFGKTSMEGLIHQEAEECIEWIKRAIKQGGSSSIINMEDKFGVSMINILWAIMGGVRYKHDDEEFKKMLKVIQQLFRTGNVTGNLVNTVPFIRHLPYFKTEFKKLIAGREAICDMLEDVIADHKKTRDPAAEPRDLIDIYLQAMDDNKSNPESTFSKDQLVQTCADLFAAGSESTSNAVAFAILHMVRNPKCQQKVHDELDRVIGKDRLPSYDDKAKIPYTFAAITESFRMSPVAPVSVPHMTHQDTKLMGYTIPKNTMAMVNYMSTNMDEKYWGDPDVFRPERFLDTQGNFDKTKADHVLGFGAGKRQCLGEPLARITKYVLFTSVMQRFRFEVPEGEDRPTTLPNDGFTVAPKPFAVKVTVRD